MMQKLKKATFNSGFLLIKVGQEVYAENIPFEDLTVTENRFNAALYSGDRIDRVIHIPLNMDTQNPNIPHNATVQIVDSSYTVWKQQPIRTSNPPVLVLTLKEFK